MEKQKEKSEKNLLLSDDELTGVAGGTDGGGPTTITGHALGEVCQVCSYDCWTLSPLPETAAPHAGKRRAICRVCTTMGLHSSGMIYVENKDYPLVTVTIPDGRFA